MAHTPMLAIAIARRLLTNSLNSACSTLSIKVATAVGG